MADFKLGRLKFKWRGDWVASTAYLLDDIAKYGGNTYVCVENHTSQSTSPNFYTDLTAVKWQLHTEGLYFKGTWAGSTHYKLNDLVKYGAFQYRTTTQHTSHATDFDGTKFEVFNEGLEWEDSYAAGTTYQDGDLVSYGGYTYVYINATPAAGQTPTDNAYWDVITTGFKALGAYSHGTAYKTGDTIQYGGNNYVAKANATNQYPANSNGSTNTTYWTLNLEGFNYESAYNAGTTYQIGDVVTYSSSSYIMLKDRNVGTTPGSDSAVWDVLSQGDSAAVLTTRGDIIIRDASAAARLAVGSANQVITTNGTDVTWGTITTVGALDSGSITSGFTSIDVGAGAITTTGVITGGTVEATTDTAAGDNAAIGYTAAEGLILTGQGSTNDVTIKNDADADVISIPTGTINVTVAGDLTVSGTGHLVPTKGTTAQRPTGGDLITGGIRYNTTLVTWEGHNGNAWTGLGGGNPWATKTGDGSTIPTAAANDRYFVDTSSFAITIQLPASPLVGDSIRFLDLAGTFSTNNLTIDRNGKKIMNLAQDLTAAVTNAGFSLIFTGDSYGWKLMELA